MTDTKLGEMYTPRLFTKHLSCLPMSTTSGSRSVIGGRHHRVASTVWLVTIKVKRVPNWSISYHNPEQAPKGDCHQQQEELETPFLSLDGRDKEQEHHVEPRFVFAELRHRRIVGDPLLQARLDRPLGSHAP